MTAVIADGTSAIGQALQRAVANARPAMAAILVHPNWTMSEAEFRAFWGGTRLAAFGNVGTTSAPHAAPVEVTLGGDILVVPPSGDSV